MEVIIADEYLQAQWLLHVPSQGTGAIEKTAWDFDDWLTVHRSITLFDLQLDAPNSYLFTYNIFITILINLLHVNK